jgi:peroxiredoxin
MHAYRDQYAQLFRNGREIVLIGISTDSPEALFEWARDDEFPFLFASDADASIGKLYGAWQNSRSGAAVDNRSLFIVNPEGVIDYVAAPFREIDPTAYEELGEAIARIAPPLEEEGMEQR